MSTVPGYGLVMGGAGGMLPASSPSPGNMMLDDETYKLLGLDPIEEEEEQDRSSLFGQILAGAGAGLLEPLSFIEPVDKVVQQLKAEQGNDLAGKVGYGLGFLGGFLVPAGVATKIGGYGIRGLQALSGVKLLQAADAGMELTRLGMLAQGSIAGGLLSAGMSDAENAQDFLMEVGTGAVLGGVGDVAIGSALRMI